MYQSMQSEVFPFIKSLHTDNGSTYAKYMDDAIFKIPTPQLLEKIVTALDELYALVEKTTDRRSAHSTPQNAVNSASPEFISVRDVRGDLCLKTLL